ncbi:MAG TPA: prepilin-type N-terminal cleavage/methylation domain-containing protein [Candidatus Saccharimonadales bacterium]|nr:prepilin-type N-terminal cleavage/methylation domain-containing protein [Candidatus Saccharimonadales bacterium]
MDDQKVKLQNGFTLIEIILYIGIFSLIIGGIVSLAFLATAARSQNQTRADLNYQGHAAMALIVQTIHDANSITEPAPGNTTSSLTLVMDDPLVDPTVFDTNTHSDYTALQINEGSPALSNDLTNSRVTISNLSFANKSVGAGNKSIMIQFDLTYNNILSRREFDYSQTFSGGATLP